MERAVRHPDGTMITEIEWSAIRASARRIVNELSNIPDSHRLRPGMRKTKMYYRTYHSKEWTNALNRLESEQPLVGLCSSNWKADHILGNSIQNILTKESYVPKSRRSKKQKGKAKAKESDQMNDTNDDSVNGGNGVSGTSKSVFS
jgi:hypothetical protein